MTTYCGYVDNLKSRLCCILVLWYISKYHMLSGRYYLICTWYVGTSLFLDSTRPNRMSEGNVCEWYLMLRWWYTLSARFSNHMLQALYMLWCAIWYDVILYKDCMIWWYGIGLAWYDMIWYGMVWYGMVWYGIWYGMVWYGMIWYDMIWYDMIWYDMIWYIGVFHCFVTHSVTSVKISKSNDHRIICKF